MIRRFSKQANNEYLFFLERDTKKYDKINELLDDIEINGASKGKGKPEPLLYNLKKYWSRHINKKDRLIYRIENEILLIYSCDGHYSDK
ncbi:MAG: Txe/YoeB family addiction module toxin [Endomicrobium sp.]|jgi:toxin YoeB|nr:Txe/YoeB family addiction module toxin [Endomicrobium sp.]